MNLFAFFRAEGWSPTLGGMLFEMIYFSANVGSMNIHFYNFYHYNFTIVSPSRAESAAWEVCEGAEEMTEPLKQCTAWLHAYFCQPARMASLPLPAFHHPLLQRGLCRRAAGHPCPPHPISQGGDGSHLHNSWSMAVKMMRFSSQQSLAERFEYEHA